MEFRNSKLLQTVLMNKYHNISKTTTVWSCAYMIRASTHWSLTEPTYPVQGYTKYVAPSKYCSMSYLKCYILLFVWLLGKCFVIYKLFCHRIKGNGIMHWLTVLVVHIEWMWKVPIGFY